MWLRRDIGNKGLYVQYFKDYDAQAHMATAGVSGINQDRFMTPVVVWPFCAMDLKTLIGTKGHPLKQSFHVGFQTLLELNL